MTEYIDQVQEPTAPSHSASEESRVEYWQNAGMVDFDQKLVGTAKPLTSGGPVRSIMRFSNIQGSSGVECENDLFGGVETLDKLKELTKPDLTLTFGVWCQSADESFFIPRDGRTGAAVKVTRCDGSIRWVNLKPYQFSGYKEMEFRDLTLTDSQSDATGSSITAQFRIESATAATRKDENPYDPSLVLLDWKFKQRDAVAYILAPSNVPQFQLPTSEARSDQGRATRADRDRHDSSEINTNLLKSRNRGEKSPQ
ncbi:hypothetical protein IAU60_003694 [Kwoniella sp. DSM 27419]